jgi:pyridoxine kinase
MIPICAAVHDLSCYAKSSLTVVLPVLEVLGVETCPLPTALLSSQTDGFDSYYLYETTTQLKGILNAWEELDLRFDALYSGFLGTSEQASMVEHFIAFQRSRCEPLVLIDPVLGDQQALYGPFDASHVEAMKQLVLHADIITPNTTEAALLLDEAFVPIFTEELIVQWAQRLGSRTGAKVVITSVPLKGETAVVSWDGQSVGLFPYEPIHASYPGCGDLFSSILLGVMLTGGKFKEAVEAAVQYTSLAIARTVDRGFETRHGVSATLILADLAMLRTGGIVSSLRD